MGLALPASILDSSIPALAHIKPWCVSVTIKSEPILTISLDSWIIISTSLGSFPVLLAMLIASILGLTDFKSTKFPSALDINVSATTRISPFSRFMSSKSADFKIKSLKTSPSVTKGICVRPIRLISIEAPLKI